MPDFIALNIYSDYKELFSALIATITTLAVFLGSKYFDGKRSKKEEEQQQLNIFKIYGYPLISSAESLMVRLHEIFEHGSRFLLDKTPDIEFYRYRYVSTIYRLCAVFGWLEAMNREIAGVDLADREKNAKVEEAISQFRDALDGNKFGNGKQLQFLADKWNLSIAHLSLPEKLRLERRIESTIWEEAKKEQVQFPSKLPKEKMAEVLKNIAGLITSHLKVEKVGEELLKKENLACVLVLTRRVSWIYRDWQRAIGNLMLEENRNKLAARRFDVMNFRSFESKFFTYQQEWEEKKNVQEALKVSGESKWFRRVDRLFSNLDVMKKNETTDALEEQLREVAETRDARVEQLRNVASTLLELIDAILETKIGQDIVTPEEFKGMLAFDMKNNPEYYQSSPPSSERPFSEPEEEIWKKKQEKLNRYKKVYGVEFQKEENKK